MPDYRVQDYKNWWTKCEGSKENIGFYLAHKIKLAKVYMLSTSMSQPVSTNSVVLLLSFFFYHSFLLLFIYNI